MQKHSFILAILIASISVASFAAAPSLSGSWRLEGEVWGGQLLVPNLEEELPGVEKMPKLTWPSWDQELDLGLAWYPSPNHGFQLELMDSGNWGVGFASDGSWGRQSTYGPVLIHQAFASYQSKLWQLRAGRLQPSLDNTLLGGGPIALEGLEASFQHHNLTFGAGAFRLSSLYWPGTDYVVGTDQLLSLSLCGQTEDLAWSLVALPTEFGSARALGGQLAIGAFGGIISGQGALFENQGKVAPAVELTGSWQWQDRGLSVAVAMVDPQFTPILSSLSGQDAKALLAEEALPFSTGSVGLAASYGRQLGRIVVEVHGAARKVGPSVQENLGAALYLPQSGGELSLSVDLICAEALAGRAKVGWQISF